MLTIDGGGGAVSFRRCVSFFAGQGKVTSAKFRPPTFPKIPGPAGLHYMGYDLKQPPLLFCRWCRSILIASR